jgi:hypothetical protein
MLMGRWDPMEEKWSAALHDQEESSKGGARLSPLTFGLDAVPK